MNQTDRRRAGLANPSVRGLPEAVRWKGDFGGDVRRLQGGLWRGGGARVGEGGRFRSPSLTGVNSLGP